MKPFKEYLKEANIEMNLPKALQILGIESGYTEEELKKSYKVLSMKYHPDKGGDVNKMTELNVANDYLKKNLGRTQKTNSSKVDWEEIHKEYKRLFVIINDELKSKFSPDSFIDYFQSIFNEPFSYKLKYREDNEYSNPTYSGVLANFKNVDGTIAFDFDVYVYLPDVKKMQMNKGLADSSSNKDISYPISIICYGYSNSSKKKMSQRDWNSDTDHNILRNPELSFPKAKLIKMKPVEVDDSIVKPMTKASFQLGLKKELDAEVSGDYFFIPLIDGNIVAMYREVFMRMGTWKIQGIGQRMKYNVDLKYRPSRYYSFVENSKTFNDFKKLKTMDISKASDYIETLIKRPIE